MANTLHNLVTRCGEVYSVIEMNEGNPQHAYHPRGHRGHQRGGRGYRGGGGGRGRNRTWQDRDGDAGEDGAQSRPRRGGRGGRPPRGLSGREIGMYYRNKSLANKDKYEKQSRPTVQMDSSQEKHLNNLLSDIKSSDYSCDNKGEGSSQRERDQRLETVTRERTDHASASTESLMDDDDGEDYNLIMEENSEGFFQTDHIESDSLPLVEMERNSALDEELFQAQQHKMDHNNKYKQMLEGRKRLPSYQMREVIISTIERNQVVVLSGETGCGKTTQVPQFILDHYIEKGDGSLCRIVCTQPRRISAISVAERVADERSEYCGNGNSSVGYQIRLEPHLPRKRGSILFCTTGIVLKWLESDPHLTRASHIILDEVHERDIQSDFLIIVVRELLRVRPNLKIVLMSATLNAEMFSQYFGNCPMLNIPGFTYAVEEFLLEDIIEMTDYTPKNVYQPRRGHSKANKEKQEERRHYVSWLDDLSEKVNPANMPLYKHSTLKALYSFDYFAIDLDLCVCLTEYIIKNKKDGAILIFLPGWDTIKKLTNLLNSNPNFPPANFRIIPLHSMLPTVNQRSVFDRPPPGVRKIVIATSIAETSITIDDVVYVIDCGKSKFKNFDAENNISTLLPEWVSVANSRQRRGRAGRVQAGECYHLYTDYHLSQFVDYQLPEMLRTRLEELCLQIKLLRLGMIEDFVSKALQPPELKALHNAIETLKTLNALDDDEALTPLGYHLARMPVDPHTGKMLLFAAMFSCLDPVLTIAASLSFKDAFVLPMGKEAIADSRRKELSNNSKSDHIMLANAFKGWEESRQYSQREAYAYCDHYFMSDSTLRLLLQMRRQFAELLCDMKFLRSKNPYDKSANTQSENLSLVRAIIAAGLYPNVARVVKPAYKHRPAMLQTKTDYKVAIHPSSVNVQEERLDSTWLVFHLKQKTAKIYLYDCTPVSPYPLLFFGGNITTEQEAGVNYLVVDNYIKMKSSEKTAKLIKDLRQELDELLQRKVAHPGVTDWEPATKEGLLMTAILDLITTEQTGGGQWDGGQSGGAHY